MRYKINTFLEKEYKGAESDAFCVSPRNKYHT